jgi:hypothetical protein
MTTRPRILYKDNARPPRSKIAILYLKKFDFIPALHPPYSLDLAPCNFFLFG